MTPTRLALVLEANTPLGLAAVRASLAHADQLIAAAPDPARLLGLTDLAAEHPGRITPLAADVRTPEGRAAIARAVSTPLTLLVAGGTDPHGPALADQHANRTLSDLDAERFAQSVSSGAFSLLAMAALLKPQLSRARVLVVGDWRGSLADRRDGGDHAMACAFAALHMAGRTLAFDLEPHDTIVAVGNPGLYRTALHGPEFQQHPETVLAGLLAALMSLPADRTGAFLDANGRERSW